MHQRGIGIERPGGHRVGRLLLVVDPDGLGGVERLVAVLGDDHGDDLADAADRPVDADEGPVDGARIRAAPVLDRPDALRLAVAGGGPVRPGEHRQHPRHRLGPGRLDARHRRMGMGAADEGGMGDGLVEGHILDVMPAPPEEPLILPPPDRLTDIHGPLPALPARAALLGGLRAATHSSNGKQYQHRAGWQKAAPSGGAPVPEVAEAFDDGAAECGAERSGGVSPRPAPPRGSCRVGPWV